MKDPQSPHQVSEMNLNPSDMMTFDFFFYLLLVHADIETVRIINFLWIWISEQIKKGNSLTNQNETKGC